MPEKTSGNAKLALGLGAVVFVIALILLLSVGDYRFIAALFVALLLAILTAIVLYLAFEPGKGRALADAAKGKGAAAEKPAEAPSADAAEAAAEAAADAARKADAEAESAKAKAEAEAKAKAEAAKEEAKAAAAKAEAEAKADAAKAEAEAAAKVQAAEDPAPSAAATPADLGEDYDGDGVLEGEDEGSRPAGLYEPRDGKADDLKAIKGIGPKLEQLCNSLGFWHFDQVANWTSDEVAWVDANLKGFKGRVSRDNWVEQARILASGGETEFSKRVGDGEVY